MGHFTSSKLMHPQILWAKLLCVKISVVSVIGSVIGINIIILAAFLDIWHYDRKGSRYIYMCLVKIHACVYQGTFTNACIPLLCNVAVAAKKV